MPIDPEFFPETALLLVGILAGGVALRFLFARQLGRGLQAGAVSATCIVLAFALARSGSLHSNYSEHWRQMRTPSKPLVLLPATKAGSGHEASEPAPSLSLLLGDVLLRVEPSDRYVLSFNNEQFLTLDSLESGLLVSCIVAAKNGVNVPLSENLLPQSPAGIQPGRPDAHTLLVQEGGEDILRVHYAERRRIEVTGHFYCSGSSDPVHMVKGIHWDGGGVPPGTSIDLRSQGKGRIDFGSSGLIRVLPH